MQTLQLIVAETISDGHSKSSGVTQFILVHYYGFLPSRSIMLINLLVLLKWCEKNLASGVYLQRERERERERERG